jgi:hypothetical protein
MNGRSAQFGRRVRRGMGGAEASEKRVKILPETQRRSIIVPRRGDIVRDINEGRLP